MALHVAVVSGSRADFGPLRPLLRGLAADSRMQLSTVVCAVGDPAEADRQVAAFLEAGLPVTAEVRRSKSVSADAASALATDAGPIDVTVQAAQALEGVSAALGRIDPDVVLLLGDRFEIAAAALGAHLLRLPVVHLSGGDETLGSLDDAMRHAISRLASLHMPTNADAARRLQSLGVPEDRIELVGSTALDELVGFIPVPRGALAEQLGIGLDGQVVAVTYHPATLADEPPAATMRALIAGVRDAAPNASIVVTTSNADEGGRDIDDAAAQMAAADARVSVVASLGPSNYWSLLHHSDVVVGNSSSALIEAPVVGVPVVDVGARQSSRLRAPSCLHAEPEQAAIAAVVTAALSRPRRPEPSPYGDGAAVPRILDLLAAITSPRDLLTPTSLRPLDVPGTRGHTDAHERTGT